MPRKMTSITQFNPALAQQWSTRNTVGASDVSINSRENYWWDGKNCDHQWDISPSYYKTHEFCCVYCTNMRIYPGLNDLATTHPEVAAQWHPTKNKLTPREVTYGSKEVITWICENNHEWEVNVKTRTILKRGCAVCSKKRVWSGENDLQTLFPEISKEWNYERNHPLTPDNISAFSGESIWWKCTERSHEWNTKVFLRTSRSRTGCPFCKGTQVDVGFNDLATLYPGLAQQWHPTLNGDKKTSEFTSGSGELIWWACAKNHQWEARICDRIRYPENTGCEECFATTFSSQGEKEVGAFISSLLPEDDIHFTTRSIIQGELDIFIPRLNVAIEFNGLYWHSDAVGKGKDYHLDKWMRCTAKGIQLISVWEDDWRDRKEVVKKMLAHKLNISPQAKIGARKTTAQIISKDEAEVFLNDNHIQGFMSGYYYLGLFYKEELVSVVVLRKDENNLNLVRYATSRIVQGGFSKLTSWVEKNIEYETMYTFADREVSQGLLYSGNGWAEDTILPPDYKYLYRGRKYHKFNFRKVNFQNNDDLIWVEGKTERELAVMNKLYRIWDCGKIRYVKHKSIAE